MQTNPSNPQRKVILAVDDQQDDIELMKILLRKAGVTYPVEVYHRGEDMMESLTALMKKSVGAVLPLLCFLDVKMPHIDGHELLRWIRQQPQLDPVSVVMLSTSEHPKDIKDAARGGAQCYLAKYPQPAVLKRVLAEAERIASLGVAAAKEWFGIPANLMLSTA